MEKRGFTLIELLVVIAIIGVLSSVVLTSLNAARAKARDAQRISSMLEIRKALLLYYSDNGAYPIEARWASSNSNACGSGRIGTLSGSTGYIPNLAPKYISVLPVDPKANNLACQGFLYASTANGSDYVLLDNLLPESYPAAGSAMHDTIRPTQAIKLCSGPATCGW
jgi:prepilin-type N-terminal cleavage/methylation domain-containing protein